MIEINLNINGKKYAKQVEPRTHLGDFLREDVGLTGTNLSCEHGVCGACTVLVDGKPVRSCITFAGACEGQTVTTIEGYEQDVVMQRLRVAFNQFHALQCGFCTPGMLATARDIVIRLPDADEKRVRVELAGNICRCTGYQGITDAILSVLHDLKQQPDPEIELLREKSITETITFSSASPFMAFEAVEEPAYEPQSVPEPQPAANSTAKDKGNVIDGEFTVAYPLEQVWAFMSDLKAVAACLPGAEVEAQEGEHVKGKVAIKFGPMSAAFKGTAVLSRDDQNHRAILKGEGTDSFSNSRARGDVSYALFALDQNKTQVKVSLDYSLQGPLAQFSRSGLVQDFVRRLIKEFSKNVELRLGNKPLSDDGVAKINPLAMLFSIYWEKFLAVFKKK